MHKIDRFHEFLPSDDPRKKQTAKRRIITECSAMLDNVGQLRTDEFRSCIGGLGVCS